MAKSNTTFFDHAVSPSQQIIPGSNRSNADGSNASPSRDTANMSISIIIGKTFEAATLPDGSQQLIEATKYKRLSDGYVYTESKMRSLDDDGGEGRGNVGFDVLEERQHDKLYNDVGISTFSSSGSFSPRNETHHVSVVTEDDGFSTNNNPFQQQHAQDTGFHQGQGPTESQSFAESELSVVTEDHGFFTNNSPFQQQHAQDTGFHQGQGPTGSFVEEYLYDTDPTGLQQFNESQPLTPSSAQRQGGGTNVHQNDGWCPAFDDGNDDNSLKLMQPKRAPLWESPAARRAKEAMRNFFPSTPTGADKATIGMAALDESDEEDEIERGVGVRKPNLPCNERMRTRRCKVLLCAMVVAVIGTIAAVVGVTVPSSRRAMDGPAKRGGDAGGEREENPPLDPQEDTVADNPPAQMTDEEELNEEKDKIIMEEIQEDAVATDTGTGDTDVVAAPGIDPPSCIHLKIVMTSTSNTNKDDVNKWSLARIDGDDTSIVDSGDAFPEPDGDARSTLTHCVKPGVYTFAISDSGGDGLGANGKTDGYYIAADGVTLGVSNFFFHEERMTFTLPLAYDAGEERGGDGNGTFVCTGDFYLAVKTDGNPEQTQWSIFDDRTGEEVLRGGPYELPWAVYTRRACLPDGDYTFNMSDEGGDGLTDDGKGFVFISKDGETIVNSNGHFGEGQSATFSLGGG